MVVNAPQITLDGNPEQLAPGARIYSATRMLVTPASDHRPEPAGQLHARRRRHGATTVWILTPERSRAQRATATSGKLLNFWPFVARSAPAPEPTVPLTPYNQLPNYGQ